MLSDGLKWGALRSAIALDFYVHIKRITEWWWRRALSVGTPVFLTDKVNLWREVTQSGAGIVYGDDRASIDCCGLAKQSA